MSESLKEKHAVVTGAAGGIGSAIVEQLISAGARVTLVGRTLATLQSRAKKMQATQCICIDITEPDSVVSGFSQAVKDFGEVDILINNAGNAITASFERTDVKLLEQMLAVNLKGAFYCSQQVLPSMRAKRNGRIVNIASTASVKGYTYVSAYCAAKHGLLGMTRALALEVANAGITVNAVCPAYTETEMLATGIEKVVAVTGQDTNIIREKLQAVNPQGRFIKPEEVAASVLWLCSPQAAGVTGQAILVDGGETVS